MTHSRLALAVAALLWLGAGAAAPDYPTMPIRIVVPFSAGGPTDVISRLIAHGIGPTLGGAIVVERHDGQHEVGRKVTRECPLDPRGG